MLKPIPPARGPFCIDPRAKDRRERMAMSVVETLFSEGLQRLYGAHQQGAKQAVANYGTSTSPKLRQMLQAGAKANLKQARRLEQVFAAAGLTPSGKADQGMQGIKDANNAMVAQASNPAARDLVNIAAGQVAAHFYIANYGTLRSYAEAMGNTEAAGLLQQTLDETEVIDSEFTKLARRLMSQSGSREYAEETAACTTAAMHPSITTAAMVLAGLAAAGVALASGRNGTSRDR